jgi:tetratricopeptide (TPR) repeat protein
MTRIFGGVVALIFLVVPAAHAQTEVTITTEPNAIVWIDGIRRGTTDASGKLTLNKVSAGARHSVRVRAYGFTELTTFLFPGRREITVRLWKTTDKADLKFQEAETARENARDDQSLQKAAELYREEAFTDDAVRSFRRAIREGGGIQPEAYVGVARVLEDKGQHAEAIVEFKKALAQLSDSEPVIYQMLGAAYEKIEKPKEAVAAYEKYLELAPNGSYASAIRSILEQLKREAAGEQIIP